MSGAGTIRVEVAYATPQRQWLLTVELPPGSTVEQAIRASGILQRVPGLAVDPQRVGVFGRRVALDQVLAQGDRVELYRPLQADPKEVRRSRAERQQGR